MAGCNNVCQEKVMYENTAHFRNLTRKLLNVNEDGFEVKTDHAAILTNGVLNDKCKYDMEIYIKKGDTLRIMDWHDDECGGRLKVMSSDNIVGYIYVDCVRKYLEHMELEINV